MVHGPYKDFVAMGVRWSVNKFKYTNATLALVEKDKVIAEKDSQIVNLNAKLFLVDDEIGRYRYNLGLKTKESSDCALDKAKLQSWAAVGKVGTVVICVGVAVVSVILITEQFK